MKNSKIITMLTVLFIAGSILFPGQTEAQTTNQTFLVGQVTHAGSGYYSWGDFSLNGVYLKDIVVALKEVSTGDNYFLLSDDGGFFYTDRLAAGQYILENVNYTKSIGEDYSWIKWTAPENFVFEILSNKVSNLGFIYWESEYDEVNENWPVNDLFHSYNYNNVMSSWKENFPHSVWNEREWVNIPISEL